MIRSGNKNVYFHCLHITCKKSILKDFSVALCAIHVWPCIVNNMCCTTEHVLIISCDFGIIQFNITCQLLFTFFFFVCLSLQRTLSILSRDLCRTVTLELQWQSTMHSAQASVLHTQFLHSKPHEVITNPLIINAIPSSTFCNHSMRLAFIK